MPLLGRHGFPTMLQGNIASVVGVASVAGVVAMPHLRGQRCPTMQGIIAGVASVVGVVGVVVPESRNFMPTGPIMGCNKVVWQPARADKSAMGTMNRPLRGLDTDRISWLICSYSLSAL